MTFNAPPARPDAPLPQALDALEFAHGALLDAIGLTEGLDSEAGLAVMQMIREALVANGRTPPQYPKDGEVVERRPFLTDAASPAAHAERLTDHEWRTCGIIEIAIRNVNVASYMNQWEGRALKAEAEVERLRAALSERTPETPREEKPTT